MSGTVWASAVEVSDKCDADGIVVVTSNVLYVSANLCPIHDPHTRCRPLQLGS